MSDTSKTVSSISIARHTAQFILRCAMDALPTQCFGLIGRKALETKDCTIAHAAPQAAFGMTKSAAQYFSECDLKHTVENWQKQAIEPCGIYFSTESGNMPGLNELKPMQNELQKWVPAFAGKPMILMPLMLNTAGCLEAFTYIISDETLLSIPLLLAEDGQQTKNG